MNKARLKILNSQFDYLISLQFISNLISGVARGEGGSFPPPPPEKFAKDGEQPRPQPAVRIDSSRKL